MDAANKEIISLWVGKQSQKAAFSFYNLQAEQLFSEEEDPISQSCIWRNINKMQPRMIVFDTKIDRLATVREVSNKKILQKMKQQQGMNSLMGIFAHIDMKPLQKHEQQEETLDPQFANWTDSEQNYKIVDQGYISLPTSSKQNPDIQLQRYLTFQEFYKINKEACQNKLRKQMERTDFLKVFTICTDETYSGFTAKTIEYLRQECPKKCYLLTSLSSVDNLPVVSLPKLYDEVDIYLPINTNCIKYKYFQNSTFSKDFAPLFSSLLTPLALKQSDPFDYLSTIMSDNRKLFNSAFTLPVIDTDLNLSKSTSIFRFQQASIKQFKKKIKLTSKQITDQFLGQKPKIKQAQVEEDQARINIANQSFLSIGNQKASGKFLSESYVLKGHFNSLEKLFQPKSQPASLSIKCLQGIFSANQQIAQVYDPFYKPYYDEKVEAYPYHLVMFSHQKFGSSMRSNLKLAQKTKIFNEQWPQCIEKVLHIADSYLEHHQESD